MPCVEDLGLCLLKYRSERTLHRAMLLYTHMRGNGLDAHPPFGNGILSIFVDLCTKKSMSNAQQVFDLLLYRDGFSWNALLLGYIRTGQYSTALFIYEKMRESDPLLLDKPSVLALIKVCAQLKNLEKGCQIHDENLNKCLVGDSSSLLCDCLIHMYLRCRSVTKAQEMFDTYPIQNVVLWTTLMTCYVEYGQGYKALTCFKRMIHMGISPDIITYLCVLKACGSIQSLIHGEGIYTQIIGKGFESDLAVGSTLIDMYVKCGLIEIARVVLSQLPIRNVVVWNALISGFVDHGSYEEALGLSKYMQCEGIPPDDVTFVCILKACGSIGDKDRCLRIHTEVVNKGFDKGYNQVCNTLIDLYVKRGLFEEAQKVFDGVQDRTIISWNALISGYSDPTRADVMLDFFDQLEKEGFSPNIVTFITILKACASTGVTTGECREIHIKISKKGLETDLMVRSTLIDTYAKYGLFDDAQSVFDNNSHQNAVSWNALLSGYDEHGCSEEALKCFDQMQAEGVAPHAATFVCTIKACGSIGLINKGQEIHVQVIARGYEEETFIGNTLVDMYTKCGSLAEACIIFNNLQVQDEVSWNAMITGYAQVGENEKVFQTFERMTRNGMKPNSITFLTILNACSHAGEMDRGWRCFEVMSKNFGIFPYVEHYTCIVDLLGRSGHVEEALLWMKMLPIHPTLVLWHAVLGASRKWCDVDIGRHAFEHAIQLDKGDAGAYICMFNIYVDGHMHEEAEKIEKLRVQNLALIKNVLYKSVALIH